MNLKGKHLLSVSDLTVEEINGLLELSAKLKAWKKAGIPHRLCEGKNIVLLFEKTSTRTRCAFEVAGHDLGMGVTYLDPTGSQIGKKESIADTARVLSRMFDGIEYRGFGQSIVEELAQYADVPVWKHSGHPKKRLHAEVFAQINLSDGLVGDDFLGRALSEHFAFVDDVGVVANAQRFSYVVVGNQNTDAAVLEEANDALNLNHGDWVDTCKRFVEQNEARIGCQCTCDFRAATFAARKREGSVGADVLNLQLVEKIVEAFFDFGARQPGACLIVLQLQNGADVILDC